MMDGTNFIKILLDSLSNLDCVIDSTEKNDLTKIPYKRIAKLFIC